MREREQRPALHVRSGVGAQGFDVLTPGHHKSDELDDTVHSPVTIARW
jgi:hypothetical protein